MKITADELEKFFRPIIIGLGIGVLAAAFLSGCYTPGPNDPSAADIHDASDTHLSPAMRGSVTNCAAVR